MIKTRDIYTIAKIGIRTYQKVKQNINRKDINVNINCVLTKINQECFEDFVEEWSQTYIRPLAFSFHTPVGDNDDEKIWLNLEQRDKVIDRILKLKNKYPNLINTSSLLLKLFKSENCGPTTER